MKRTFIGLAAGAALTLSAGTALADGYDYGSAKDAPMATPQVNWNGLYLGAAVGYGISSIEEIAEAWGDDPEWERLDGFNAHGFQGALTIGYDRQIHDGLVVGVFGDYAFGKLQAKEVEIEDDPETGTLSINDSWAIGVRLGLIRSCCTMWYATAGYAQAKLERKGDIGEFEGEDDDRFSTKLHGWFVGGGVEQQLHNNLFLKLDYRYTSYDKERFTWDDSDGGGYADYDTDVHTVRLGLNWKVDLFGRH